MHTAHCHKSKCQKEDKACHCVIYIYINFRSIFLGDHQQSFSVTKNFVTIKSRVLWPGAGRAKWHRRGDHQSRETAAARPGLARAVRDQQTGSGVVRGLAAR